MRIELKPALEGGYELTEEDRRIMAKYCRQTYDHINNQKIIDLPELYPSREDYQRIYDNCVGNVLKALDKDNEEKTGDKNG